jgi:hypothetical protein
MSDDDTDNTDDTEDYSTTAADPVLIALQLCTIANNKTLAAAVRKLCKLDRQYAETEAKCAALAAQAQQTATALDARAAELAAREAAITKREDEFAVSAQDVRDELRAYHNHLEQTQRVLAHRILATSGISWNENLQAPPTWQQLRQMVPELPPDPPGLSQPAAPALPIDALSDTFADPNADRHGLPFVPGSTLTRSLDHKRGVL